MYIKVSSADNNNIFLKDRGDKNEQEQDKQAAGYTDKDHTVRQ